MDSKTFLENFGTIADAPNGISLLRELILDLALRGKITRNDDSASAVSLPLALEEPFAIPPNWVWAALPDVTRNLGQEMPRVDFQYIDVSSIDNKAGLISKELRVITPKMAPSRARKRVSVGTVLYSTVRPYLRNIAIVETNYEPKAIASTAFAVLHPEDFLDSKFLFICVRSGYFKSFVESKQKGVAYPAINDSDLKSAKVPVPPLSEQRRIVAKVDELMALCDELEELQVRREVLRSSARSSAIDSLSTATTAAELKAAWRRIYDTWTILADSSDGINSLRALIGNLALQGRLTYQDDNDESIESVTAQIAKVRGERGLSEIDLASDQNWSGVELPKNWAIVPFGFVHEFVNGYAFPSSDYRDQGVGIIRMTELKKGEIRKENLKFVPTKYLEQLDQKLRVLPGDLVIAMSGATTGGTAINTTDEVFLLNQRVGKIVPILINIRFISIYLVVVQKEFLEAASGTGIPNLSTRQIREKLFPLPSFAEQKRVVEKYEELIAICDELESQIHEREYLAERLARSGSYVASKNLS